MTKGAFGLKMKKLVVNLGGIPEAVTGVGMRAGVIRAQLCVTKELCKRGDVEVQLAFSSGLTWLRELLDAEPWLGNRRILHSPWQIALAKWIDRPARLGRQWFSAGGSLQFIGRILLVMQRIADESILSPSSKTKFDAIIQGSPPFPSQALRRIAGRKYMIVHDVIRLVHPEWFEGRNRRDDQVVADLNDNAIRLFVDSQHTARDVERISARTMMDIRVIPLGGGETNLKLGLSQPDPVWGDLPERYFLCVGTLEIRKNLETALRAYCLYRERFNKSSPPALLIVGAKGWLTERLDAARSALPEDADVRFLGFVPDEHLNYLYRNAICLIYLSRYEGFGLPPLEAMAWGTPVIAANNTCLPEVVGDTGILISPDDVEGAAEAMNALFADENLRSRLSNMASERAASFTWEKCVDVILDEIASQPLENDRGNLDD